VNLNLLNITEVVWGNSGGSESCKTINADINLSGILQTQITNATVLTDNIQTSELKSN